MLAMAATWIDMGGGSIGSGGVGTSVLDKAAWWQGLFDGVTSAITAAGSYFNKVSFSIKTGVFNAEIEHSTDSAHADQRC